MLRVSRKLIMFQAKSIYNEKCGHNEALKAGIVASNGWLTKTNSEDKQQRLKRTISTLRVSCSSMLFMYKVCP